MLEFPATISCIVGIMLADDTPGMGGDAEDDSYDGGACGGCSADECSCESGMKEVLVVVVSETLHEQ